MRNRAAFLVLVALGGAACGDASLAPTPQKVTLAVWNRTQRPLEDLRVHDDVDYRGAANLLLEPLADERRVEVDFKSGQRVTVMRRNVDGAPLIAFSTARGLVVPRTGYVLMVLQESFRLVPPNGDDDGAPAYEPGGDGGPGAEEQPAGGDL